MDKKIFTWLEENWLSLLIVFGIGYFIIYPMFNKKDTTTIDDSLQVLDSKSDYEITNKDFNSGIKFKVTSQGFDIFQYDDYIGSLQGDEDIDAFVKNLKKSEGSYLKTDQINDNKSENNIGIVIDNTYSYWNDVLDKTLPQKRMETAIDYLSSLSTLGDGTSGKIGRLFAHKYATKEERMNEENYEFKIDSSLPMMISLSTGNKDQITYLSNKKKLHIPNTVTFELSTSNNSSNYCNYISTYSFVCRSKEDFLNEINHIYMTKYNVSDDDHQGTFLFDYLFAKGFYELNDLYVFTDGEFQIASDTSKAYLSVINNSYKLKSTLIFNNQEYQRAISYYEKYWNAIMPIVNSKLTSCATKNNTIIFVGLTSHSVSFMDLMQRVYQGMFEGCDVSFKF